MRGADDYCGVLASLLTRAGVLVGAADGVEDVRRFEALVAEHGDALQRLTFGYEASPEARRDLHQEILVALWRALPTFEGRSSLKTWVFRIAHNVSASHVLKARRRRTSRWQSLDDLIEQPGDGEGAALSRLGVESLARLVRELGSLDRQLVLLFLEGFSPGEIADVTGLSGTNVSTKLSRLRSALRAKLEQGPSNE
jgi:RNA polymerase sigma-70 factor (ECF subfamily)